VNDIVETSRRSRFAWIQVHSRQVRQAARPPREQQLFRELIYTIRRLNAYTPPLI